MSSLQTSRQPSTWRWRVALAAALTAPLVIATGDVRADEGDAYACEGRPSASSAVRAPTGLYLGATMGRGAMGISCDGCRPRPDLDEALSATALLGYRLAPRLAVFGEYWLTRWQDRDGTWFDQPGEQTVTQTIVSGGAQLWATRRLWFRAQLGYGRHHTTADYGERVTADEDVVRSSTDGVAEPPMSLGASDAFATAVTAGFDIVHTRTFGMSAELRHGRTRADSKSRSIDLTAVSVGLTWY